MPTHYYAVTAVKRLAYGAIVAVALCLVAESVAHVRTVSAESTVQAIVCREPASLAIVQPVSDSVVATSELVMSGSVTQSNQLEIYVDGAFSGVVPLSAAATQFSANVQLSAGTHTVKLVAVDACQIGNGEASVVVTYQPAITSSTGSQTPTEIGGHGGVTIGPSTEEMPATPDTFVDHWVVQPFHALESALDLSTGDSQPGTATTVPPATRLFLLAGGALVMIFAAALARLAFIAKPLAALGAHLGLPLRYTGRVLVIVAGVILVMLAFIL